MDQINENLRDDAAAFAQHLRNSLPHGHDFRILNHKTLADFARSNLQPLSRNDASSDSVAPLSACRMSTARCGARSLTQRPSWRPGEDPAGIFQSGWSPARAPMRCAKPAGC